MWNGKNKAFTMSYDDGITQDIRFIEIIEKYGLKCTFNLNSVLMDERSTWNNKGVSVVRMSLRECRHLYDNHEIAVHGARHLHLPDLSENDKMDELYNDKIMLEERFNVKINGMAYAFGEYDNATIEVLKKCDLKYGRTVSCTNNFEISRNLLCYEPTAHHNDKRIFELIDEFVNLKTDDPKVFYLWGHTYEFDVDKNWDRIEEICKRISGKSDIFYGTNHEVLSPFYK